MDYVIKLSTIADYFGVKNYLLDDCILHFHDNFSIEHLPDVIPQVTETSACINSGTLNVFICRYFTKIVATTVWLNYPIKTIEYIFALDLMISSEMQVFDAIMKWVNFKVDYKKCYLKRLLKLIRWCHLECKDLAEIKKNKYVKPLKFEPKLCSRDKSGCACSIDRTKQNCVVAIEKLHATDLRVKVLNRYFLPLINKVVEPDDSMPLHLVHNEHVSDILFDSGRQMIRVDWERAKYRLLDYKLHYLKIRKCVFEDQRSEIYSNERCQYSRSVGSLLEANDNFVLFRDDNYWFRYCKTPTTGDINEHFVDSGYKYLATVLDKDIYMIKNNLEFYQFNFDGKLEYKKVEIQRLKDFDFDNLLLTSTQANDDKVIIIDKSTKALFCYNVKTDKWSSMGRISNFDSRSADGRRESDELLTFTSTFLSMNAIKLCIDLNLNK